MKKDSVSKVGERILASNGEYSDYQVMGLFVVAKQFCWAAELAEFLEKNPEQATNYRFNDYQFLAGLSAKGLLDDLSYREVHLGSYSSPPNGNFWDN